MAAILEGLLRHGTEMEVEKNYVDTGGQSLVAFAFCHLLSCRCFRGSKASIVRSSHGPQRARARRLSTPYGSPLTRPIRWDLIRQQYDQMIKYAGPTTGDGQAVTILPAFGINSSTLPTKPSSQKG